MPGDEAQTLRERIVAPTTTSVRVEMTRIRKLFEANENNGDREDLTAYAKAIVELRDLLAVFTPDEAMPWPTDAQFQCGALVQKKGRASWRGKIVGWYRTEVTALGYAVESAFEPGSVQIYPETALLPWGGAADEAMVERVTQQVYEQRPFTAISPALVEAAGVGADEPIPWEKSIELGADHSGLRWIVRAALTAALNPEKVG
jgi:dihydrofolate reductase (trimethoprim resistance protein)